RKVAGIARDDDSVEIVDLALGRVLDHVYVEVDPGLGSSPGDFFDDTQLGTSFGSASGVVWRSDRDSPTWLLGAAAFAAGRAVIAADFSGLAIATPGESPRYLGYRMGSVRSVWPTRDGWVASTDSGVVQLDPRLRERKTFDIPKGFGQIQLVDAGRAL